MGICCMAQGTQIGALYQAPMRGGMRREMGGRFKMEGIYVYLWLIHVEVWQKTTKFCKTIILLLKNPHKNQKIYLLIYVPEIKHWFKWNAYGVCVCVCVCVCVTQVEKSNLFFLKLGVMSPILKFCTYFLIFGCFPQLHGWWFGIIGIINLSISLCRSIFA